MGTSMVHQWVHRGAKRSEIGEVKAARVLIARAVQIKPNAHLGREKYQLMVMDWVIDPNEPRPSWYSSGPVPLHERLDLRYEHTADVARGLSGLVMLGGAWESPDTFEALSQVFRHHNQSHLEDLASLRTSDLIRNGHSFLIPDTNSIFLANQRIQNEEDRGIYTSLRKEADDWQAKRLAYMMPLLKAGRHPDTDPHFWDKWHDPGPPRQPFSFADVLAVISDHFGGQDALGGIFFLLGTSIAIALYVRDLHRRLRTKQV